MRNKKFIKKSSKNSSKTTKKTNNKNKSTSKHKKKFIKKRLNMLKTTKGIKPHQISLNNFNLWDTIFNPYHITYMYIKGKFMFAELVIYKEPINNIRGFIHFYIDGPITLNRLDSKSPDSVYRIVVGIDDRIIFRVNNDRSNILTNIEYVPKYQVEMEKTSSELQQKKVDFGYVSKDRIKDIQEFFSWLQYTDEPRYLEDIINKIEIKKGVIIKDKELIPT